MAEIRCNCGRTVWRDDTLDYCPDCGQFNPAADAGAESEYRETLHAIHVRRGVFVPSCEGCRRMSGPIAECGATYAPDYPNATVAAWRCTLPAGHVGRHSSPEGDGLSTVAWFSAPAPAPEWLRRLRAVDLTGAVLA